MPYTGSLTRQKAAYPQSSNGAKAHTKERIKNSKDKKPIESKGQRQAGR